MNGYLFCAEESCILITPQIHNRTPNYLRNSIEALLNHKGWASSTTLTDEFVVRDAVCGAISNAPATDRTKLLESLCEDFQFIVDALSREIEYRNGYPVIEPVRVVEKSEHKTIFHSPKEVADEFGLVENNVKSKLAKKKRLRKLVTA